MIHDFLSSWGLFQNTYLAGWAMGLLLSQVGVIVVARDQIFIGAAVSQASGLGIAWALWLGDMLGHHAQHWSRSDLFLSAMAVAFSVGAALVTARGNDSGGESHEAVTGWVFLFSGSISSLILAHSPHGLDEIQRLASSSIIGATAADVWVFGSLAIMTAWILVFFHRPLLLLSMDRPMAEALGMRTGIWSAAVCAWLGLTVGLSIRSAGMLYTFGCLVLPALLAKRLCREVWSMFVVAPLVFLGVSIPGFVLANHLDSPSAQMTVGLLTGGLALIWTSGLVTRRPSPWPGRHQTD